MRILILGGDGYLGWPTAMYFSVRGHEVHTVDNYLRRRAHQEAGTDSLTPIMESLPARAAAWRQVTGYRIGVTEGDLCEWPVVEKLIRDFEALRGTMRFEDEPASFEAALVEAASIVVRA